MEPKSPEQLPTPIEYTPSPVSPERLPPSPEQAEVSPERNQEQRQNAMPPATPAAQLPTPVAISAPTTDVTTTTPVQADDNPTVAADEDLIEKEWVDKAKKIIADTRDDPHAREQEVGKLQADYLKKRYGKELGNQT